MLKQLSKNGFVVGWAFTSLGLVASILTALIGIPPHSAWLAGFLITAVISLFFGAGAFLLSVQSTLRSAQRQLTRLNTDVRCSYAGNSEDAVRYVMQQCKSGAVKKLQDTHVRFTEDPCPYSDVTYGLLREGFEELLKSHQDAHAIIVAGRYRDATLMRDLARLAVQQGENRFTCYRVRNDLPLMSVLILDYFDHGREVLFGWKASSG